MTENKSSMDKINEFRDARDWRQFHNEKDLALSISIEAAELLELFQWKEATEAVEKHPENLKDELADVLIYCYMLADNLGLDIDQIIESKLNKNTSNYPISKSKGQKDKYTELN
nr:nucleotide pyrophosphohydrolase [Lacticigenium naphthae]